jgi:hypothetical protein
MENVEWRMWNGEWRMENVDGECNSDVATVAAAVLMVAEV